MLNVYVDMDGVIADWHYAAAFTISRMIGDTSDKKVREIAEAFDDGAVIENYLPDAEFWQGVAADGGARWWRRIPEVSQRYRKALCVIDLMRIKSPINIRILTALPWSGGAEEREWCAAGKTRWLCDRGLDKRAIICNAPDKAMLANGNAVLIDDSLDNVTAFRKAGGFAFHYKTNERTHGDVRSFLEHILELRGFKS